MLRRAATAGMLLVGMRLLTRVADLVTVLVLARILEPKSFGLVAIAMSLVSIVEAALELPLHAALLRQDEITEAHYNSAFTLGAIRGAVIGLGLIAIAIPFSGFYHDPRLVMLVCALSIAPVARGLISPRLAAFQKELSFWRDFAIEGMGKLFGVTVAITLALTTRSYWAIAAGMIASPIGMAVSSYVLAPHRPRFTVKEFPAFVDFLGWNSAAQMVSAVNWQIERLVLGKVQPPAQLGLFTTGNDIAGIPFMAIFGPIFRPMYAAFTHSKDNIDQLRTDYARACSAILLIGLPLLIGESCIAGPMVRLILGEKWIAATPIVFWLALSYIPGLFTLPSIALFMALGNTNLLFRRHSVELCVKLPIVIVGAVMYGFVGVVVARVVSELAANAFCLFMVRRMIGLSFRSQLFTGWRSVVSGGVMLGPVLLCNRLIPDAGGITPALVHVGAALAVGAPVYFLAHTGLWLLAKRPDGIEAIIWTGVQSTWGKLKLRNQTAA